MQQLFWQCLFCWRWWWRYSSIQAELMMTSCKGGSNGDLPEGKGSIEYYDEVAIIKITMINFIFQKWLAPSSKFPQFHVNSTLRGFCKPSSSALQVPYTQNYTGSWVAGVKEGFGVMFWKDGDRFIKILTSILKYFFSFFIITIASVSEVKWVCFESMRAMLSLWQQYSLQEFKIMENHHMIIMHQLSLLFMIQHHMMVLHDFYLKKIMTFHHKII